VSIVIHEPSSLVAVADQCDMVERWAETCESVAELREASNRLAAIDEYLNRTSIEGRGRVAATLRRLEVRIGRLLGKALHGGARRNVQGSRDGLELSRDQREKFRNMAQHADLVEALAERSTDDRPLSRRQVLQAIAEAERELLEEQDDIDERRRATTEWNELARSLQPDDFDPVADAELTRQRGALRRLTTDIVELGDPDDFVERHADYRARLLSILPTAKAARQWLEAFIAATGE